MKVAIKDSPGYCISMNGEVYNKEGKKLAVYITTDGYERISLPSIRFGKRVNRTVHLLVAEAFLDDGKYVVNDGRQVNHIDGNKRNNHVSNLEIVTGTENVNHAHDNGLYTYNLRITLFDIKSKTKEVYRSLRALSRKLNVSINYLRPRIPISAIYPLGGRYVLKIDAQFYIKHISTIKNHKRIYVYDHVSNSRQVLTSVAQISLLYGISYIAIGKKLLKNKDSVIYSGGYSFSMKPIRTPPQVSEPKTDRLLVWKKLASDNKLT